MTGALWVPGINHRDLSNRPGGAGYVVEGWRPKGLVLHVNDSPVGSYGTSVDWYAAGGGSDQVCPNWQVYPDGDGWQLLPANTQPWCQRAGNQWGVAIETGGNHAEPLTDAAIETIARIVRFMHDEWGIPYQVTNTPSRHGLGTHEMGGAAWGGHPCPGSIRAGQRRAILAAAKGSQPGTPPAQPPQGDDVSQADVINALESAEGQAALEKAIKPFFHDMHGKQVSDDSILAERLAPIEAKLDALTAALSTPKANAATVPDPETVMVQR